jgi:hypothetical protein
MHTQCHRGKYVEVKLKNGDIIIDRFFERKARWIVFYGIKKILKKDIVIFTVIKNLQ